MRRGRALGSHCVQANSGVGHWVSHSPATAWKSHPSLHTAFGTGAHTHPSWHICLRSHADGLPGSCLRGSAEACGGDGLLGCVVLCPRTSHGDAWRGDPAQPYRARKHPNRRGSGEVTCCSEGGSFENRNQSTCMYVHTPFLKRSLDHASSERCQRTLSRRGLPSRQF